MDFESLASQKFEGPVPFLNMRDILTVVFKYRFTIIGIFLTTTFCSILFPLFVTPIYEAKTSLLVKIGREHMIMSEVGDTVPQMSVDLKTLVDPELAILTSEDLRRRVIESLGLQVLYPNLVESSTGSISPLNAALQTFEKNFDARQKGESNVMVLTLKHQDPDIAARALNLLTEYWKEQHLKIFSTPQAPFLEEQATTYRARLEESETRLQEFQQGHGISSFLDEKRLLLEQRQDLDTKLKAVQNDRQSVTAKIVSLENQLKSQTKEIPLSIVNEKRLMIDDTKRELLDLRRKEQELLGKFQAKSRLVGDVRREILLIEKFIEEQEAQLKDTVTSGRNPVHQELELQLLNAESQYVALNSQNRVLAKQIQEISEKIRQFSQLEKEFDELEREVMKDQENLKRYLEKVEVARITQELNNKQIANVSVIQPATVPVDPIRPKRTLIAIVGGLLGGFTSLGLAFVFEAMQSSYTRPEQVSHQLQVPVLVSINYKG